MKIVYNKINSILTMDTNDKSFENTIIYVPNSYNFDLINLYIDGNLVETKKSVSNKAGYKMYEVKPSMLVDTRNDVSSVILQGINFDDKSIFSFNEISARLNFDKYNELVTKYYSSQIAEDIAEKYEKIYKMVELSAKIYESIKKSGDAK